MIGIAGMSLLFAAWFGIADVSPVAERTSCKRSLRQLGVLLARQLARSESEGPAISMAQMSEVWSELQRADSRSSMGTFVGCPSQPEAQGYGAIAYVLNPKLYTESKDYFSESTVLASDRIPCHSANRSREKCVQLLLRDGSVRQLNGDERQLAEWIASFAIGTDSYDSWAELSESHETPNGIKTP